MIKCSGRMDWITWIQILNRLINPPWISARPKFQVNQSYIYYWIKHIKIVAKIVYA